MQPLFLFEDINAILGEMQRWGSVLCFGSFHISLSRLSSFLPFPPGTVCSTMMPAVCGSLKPAMALPDIVSLLAGDPKFASLLLLRLDVRAQVRQGGPRMRYP